MGVGLFRSKRGRVLVWRGVFGGMKHGMGGGTPLQQWEATPIPTTPIFAEGPARADGAAAPLTHRTRACAGTTKAGSAARGGDRWEAGQLQPHLRGSGLSPREHRGPRRPCAASRARRTRRAARARASVANAPELARSRRRRAQDRPRGADEGASGQNGDAASTAVATELETLLLQVRCRARPPLRPAARRDARAARAAVGGERADGPLRRGHRGRGRAAARTCAAAAPRAAARLRQGVPQGARSWARRKSACFCFCMCVCVYVCMCVCMCVCVCVSVCERQR